MKQYHDLVKHVLNTGERRGDRTGTGTISSFGHQIRFNLQEGFPIVTTKFTAFRLVAVELLWLLSGSTNIKYLLDNNCHIWDEWATEGGELGPVYGKQWRSWAATELVPSGTEGLGGPYYDLQDKQIDQIQELLDGLKNKPNSRRHIVSAWNVADLPDESKSPVENAKNGKMALPPCHTLFQFYVSDMSVKERADWYKNRHEQEAFWFAGQGMDFHKKLDELGAPRQKLSCQLYQRSADLFLGAPFNIASYSLLTHMIAQECGFGVGEYIHTFGDAHIYLNHLEQVNEMLSRDFKELPKLKLNPEVKSIFDFTMDDIKLENYEHHPSIKAPVSI